MNPRTLPVFKDGRGALSAAEEGKEIPFAVKRVFWVYGIESQVERGNHAHRECEEYVVCINGKTTVTLDRGGLKTEFTLQSPETGLHVPPATWISYRMEPGAVVLVLASHPYDAADHIKDYELFLQFARERSRLC